MLSMSYFLLDNISSVFSEYWVFLIILSNYCQNMIILFTYLNNYQLLLLQTIFCQIIQFSCHLFLFSNPIGAFLANVNIQKALFKYM